MTDTNKEEERKPESKNGKKHRKRIFIPIIIVVIAAAVAVFYWYEYLRGVVSTDDAAIDSDAITISSKMLGRIVALHADEGDSVGAGELLVQLDDSDLKAQEAEAKASLDYIRNNVQIARVTLERAREDYFRDSLQFTEHTITREKFDHTRNAYRLAEAELAAARSHVQTAQAQLAVIETQLNNTRIIASISAIVAKKWVVPGDIVQPGQPIFTLYDLNDIWVTANLEETKLASISRGDSVEISVDAYSNRKFHGTVKLIGAAAASRFSLIPPNNASGNFTKVTQRVPIRVEFSDLRGKEHPALLPGMSVVVKIRKSGK